MRLVPKFLSRRRKAAETDADDGDFEEDQEDAVPDDERIEVKTERIRDASEPIELKVDVPEEVSEDAAADQPEAPPQTREELVKEALANRAKAKKVFDELKPETRDRIFSAVLGPDWKSQYEDDA